MFADVTQTSALICLPPIGSCMLTFAHATQAKENPAGCKSRLQSFFPEFLSAQNDDETVGYIIPYQPPPSPLLPPVCRLQKDFTNHR